MGRRPGLGRTQPGPAAPRGRGRAIRSGSSACGGRPAGTDLRSPRSPGAGPPRWCPAGSTCITPSPRMKRAPRSRAPSRGSGPRPRPERHEALGIAGAVGQEVGARVGREVVHHRLAARRDPVDGGVGEPRQRHGGGVDDRDLRRPFGRHGLGERARRQGEGIAGRRVRRAAVEGQPEAVAVRGEAGLPVEPFRQGGLARAARRAGRIGLGGGARARRASRVWNRRSWSCR